MFNNMKKEGLLSIVSSAFIGILGFFLFQLTPDQSVALSLFLVVFFFFLFYVYKNLIGREVPSESPVVPEEKYIQLEKAYEEIASKAEKLEKQSRGTEMFLASMSHEIRTPLNGIVGMTELLDDTELTEEQKEFVSMIRESSNNLRVIVNDILDVSKINAGKMELERIPFDLFNKIDASVAMFVPKMEEKGIVLNLFTDPKVPHQVIGDPTRLSQVVINLVSNAVKFTEKGGHIDVYVEYVKEKDDSVTFTVSVSDSGIGLTEEQQAKIFDAYSQAEASTTRKAGGTGLGLTISSKIIKSMGGELKVKSSKGEGATFFFTLTLPKAESIEHTVKTYENVRVGVLFPQIDPGSRWNEILKAYIESFGVQYRQYSMEELFDETSLPDILIVEHTGMAQGMMGEFGKLNCKRVLLTSSASHAHLDEARKIFDEVVYMPATLEKIEKILHLRKEVKEAAWEHEKEEETKESGKKTFENLHVLVAEDNPINQKLIKIVLENFGLKVTLVSNGEEALRERMDNTFDMIFMDIQMPVMGGVEATHKILEYEKAHALKHIPIIALTANALAGDREKYMTEGMDDYATKPLEIKAIEKLVSQYCEV